MAKCANCGQREGTIRWGDMLALTHGFTAIWCEVCALEKQIEHARARAAELPKMEARLAELTCGPKDGE